MSTNSEPRSIKAARSDVSRRAFLRALVASTGASALAPALVPLRSSGPLLAASAPRTMPPHFVTGTLISVTAEGMTLWAAGYDPETFSVSFQNGTQFCRRGCSDLWSTLVLGDRIQAGTFLTYAGERVANWVNANPMSGWGWVTSNPGSHVLVRPMPPMKGDAHSLAIEPYTKVFIGKTQRTGDGSGLQVGNAVYFTGTRPDPNATGYDVWAFTVYRTYSGRNW